MLLKRAPLQQPCEPLQRGEPLQPGSAKARLADAFADDREAYTQGKTAFVRQVLSGAAGGG